MDVRGVLCTLIMSAAHTKTSPKVPRRSAVSGDRSKTLYLKAGESEIWERASRLLPFHLNMSVSEFCTAKIREIVEKLENK